MSKITAIRSPVFAVGGAVNLRDKRECSPAFRYISTLLPKRFHHVHVCLHGIALGRFYQSHQTFIVDMLRADSENAGLADIRPRFRGLRGRQNAT